MGLRDERHLGNRLNPDQGDPHRGRRLRRLDRRRHLHSRPLQEPGMDAKLETSPEDV